MVRIYFHYERPQDGAESSGNTTLCFCVYFWFVYVLLICVTISKFYNLIPLWLEPNTSLHMNHWWDDRVEEARWRDSNTCCLTRAQQRDVLHTQGFPVFHKRPKYNPKRKNVLLIVCMAVVYAAACIWMGDSIHRKELPVWKARSCINATKPLLTVFYCRVIGVNKLAFHKLNGQGGLSWKKKIEFI